MLRFRHRGIVLLSVMFVAVMIAMYITSSLVLTKGQFDSLQLSSQGRRAEEAARSGLEYAQARLEENPNWRGDGNAVIVNSPALTVREDRGNVIGLLTTSDGGRAQFLIRFNYQDGAGGGDGFDDPGPDMWIYSPHVSLNRFNSEKNLPSKTKASKNKSQSSEVTLPLGSGSNFSVGSDYSSDSVPSLTAGVVCEGRSYSELVGADKDSPNPKAAGSVSSKVIMGVYGLVGLQKDDELPDAVAMAGGDATISSFSGNLVEMSSQDGSVPSTLRSRGDIFIRKPKGFNKKGDLQWSPAGIDSLQAKLMASKPKDIVWDMSGSSSGVSAEEEKKDSKFYEISWDQANKTSKDAAKLKAGVYVYWQEDDSIHYYNKNYSEYKDFIQKYPDNKGDDANVTLPEGLSFHRPDADSSKYRFELDRDVDVVPRTKKVGTKSVEVSDLTILPRAGAKESLVPDSGMGLNSMGSGLDIDQDQYIADGSNQGYLIKKIIENITLTPQTVPRLLQRIADGGNLVRVPSSGGAVGSPAFGGGEQKEIGDPVAPALLINWSTAGAGGGNTQLSFSQLLGDGAEDIPSYLTDLGAVKMTNVSNPNLGVLQPTDVEGEYVFRPDAIARIVFGGAGDGMSENSSSDTLGAGNFEVVLGGESSPQGARLSVPGSVNIAASVRGSGASIVAGGRIKLVGAGFDIDSAHQDEEADVSLYAKGDISISTLKRTDDKPYVYTGIDLKGVLYSWQNIGLQAGEYGADKESISQWARIRGAVIAYGGKPGKDKPGNKKDSGNLNIAAGKVSLDFDPSYLMGLLGDQPASFRIGVLSTSYR